MEGFAQALGDAIREAREEAGLSLRGLLRASGGRFKPSAVGGYERGERDISVARFTELCAAIGAAPEQILSAALRNLPGDGQQQVTIDLARLADSADEVADVVEGFAHRVKAQRKDWLTDVVTLRAGDLKVLAHEAGEEPETLLRHIHDAVIRVGTED